jgi:hypothetical protein
VPEKTGILVGDERLDDRLGKFGDVDHLPVFQVELVDQFVPVPVDPGDDAGPVILQRGDARQALDEVIERPRAGDRDGESDEEQGGKDLPQNPPFLTRFFLEILRFLSGQPSPPFTFPVRFPFRGS